MHQSPFLKKSLSVAVALATTAMVSAPAIAAPGFLEEVLVTGSHIKRSADSSIAPINTFDRASLESSGSATLTDFMKDISVNAGSEFQTDTFSQNASQATASVNLRGLGLGSTLVLVNGNRMTLSAAAANDGSTFVDINAIPKMMVERVEILKEGAAATYGSDAVAGVVNFILNTDFDGFEISADYQTTDTDHQEDYNLGLLWGVQGDKSSFVWGTNYFKRTPMLTGDRSEFTAGTGVSNAGQPGSFLVPTAVIPIPLPPGTPGAVPFIDPGCEAGGGDADVQRAITPALRIGFCNLDFTNQFDLVTEEERLQTMINYQYRFSDTMKLYSELLYSYAEAPDVKTSASFPILDFPVVPQANPYSPTGTNLAQNVTGGLVITDSRFIGRTLGNQWNGVATKPASNSRKNETSRVLLGLEGEFSPLWTYDAAVQYSTNEYELRNIDTLKNELQMALNGLGGTNCTSGVAGDTANGCYWWNPTGGIPSWVADKGSYIYQQSDVVRGFTGEAQVERKSELFTAEAVVSGELAELEHGSLGLAVGLQYRKEWLQQNVDTDYANDNYVFLIGGEDFDVDQDVYAVFAELNAPLAENFEAQAAVRYEDYGGDIGSSFDTKLALRWEVSEFSAIRASGSTSFRAPSLHQQAGGALVLLDEVSDPLFGGTPNFTAVRPFGNPDLDPEEAVSYNFGMIFTPFDNTSFTIDYWDITVDDIIVKESPQAIVNANPFDSRVTRDPGLQRIQLIETKYINSGEISTDGLDFTFNWSHDTENAGSFFIASQATFINSYKLQDNSVANSAKVDVVGLRNFNNFARSLPEWKGKVAFSWVKERHTASVVYHFTDSYGDDQINAGEPAGTVTKISNHETVDLQYGYALDVANDAVLNLQFGIINVGDVPPPNVNTSMGFDTKVADPRGRLLYTRVSYSF